MKEFKKLDFPRLREYYTKYPQGYTIYESLLDIFQHINEMTDTVNLTLNQWEQIETWVLNELKQYSIDQLQVWLDNGTLEEVINEALFNSKADKTELAALETQLADVKKDVEKNDERITHNKLINHTGTKPLITWIDDDGSVLFFDYFMGLASEYGITFTSAISGDRIGKSGKLSAQQIKTLTANGLEVVCHGYSHDINHRLGDMSDEEIHLDFQYGKAALKAVGANYRTIVYPFGQQDNRIRDIARQYFECGVRTADGGVGGINYDPFDQYALLRIDVDSPNSSIFPLLDEAMSNGRSVILMSHIGQEGWPTDIQNRALIEYALNLGFKFATMEEWIRHNGNLLQIGENIISKTGNVSGQLGTVEISRVGDYAVNAPLTDFPLRKTTYVKVRNTDVPEYGIPNPLGGGIFSYRDTDDFFSYQMYIGGGNTSDIKTYIRKWTGANWTEWYSPTSYDHARSLTQYTINSPITDFAIGQTTVFRVNSADAHSQGLTGYGYIECLRFVDDTYSIQKFQRVGVDAPDGKRETFERSWVNGAWTDWT